MLSHRYVLSVIFINILYLYSMGYTIICFKLQLIFINNKIKYLFEKTKRKYKLILNINQS